MTNLLGASVELDEIVGFLKSHLQLKEVLQKISYQKIINQAAQERGLTVTSEEIQTEANRQRHEKRLEKASDTLAWLADQMISPEDWEKGIREQLLSKKLAEYLFAKEVEKFFAQNKITFDQLLIYQIIVADGSLAQEIFYEIEEQEISFYQAAHLYDIDEKRRQKFGFEGELYRWQFKPAVAAVVFSSPLGEVTTPLKTNQGYHLFMVEKFIPAELTPQKYQELLDGMFSDWLASELNYMLHNKSA
ncbi:MAG: peptidylprolyl isomerase [Potamolinea sp.]